MKNREYYYDEIMNADKMNFCETFTKPRVLKRHSIGDCERIDCAWCYARLALWLDEEYNEELEINWEEVEIDSLIVVSNDQKHWYKRYFARYEDGKVHTWISGATSWTTLITEPWEYAKLREKEDETEQGKDKRYFINRIL